MRLYQTTLVQFVTSSLSFYMDLPPSSLAETKQKLITILSNFQIILLLTSCYMYPAISLPKSPHNTHMHALWSLYSFLDFVLTPSCRPTSEELNLWSTDKNRGNLISCLGYLTKYNLSLVHPFAFNFIILFFIIAEYYSMVYMYQIFIIHSNT